MRHYEEFGDAFIVRSGARQQLKRQATAVIVTATETAAYAETEEPARAEKVQQVCSCCQEAYAGVHCLR
jgi:hypothetical protein